MVQTEGVADLMNRHLEEINPLVTDITDTPGLRIIKMDISGDAALLGQVSVGQGASSSIKWITIAVLGRLEPARQT